MHESNFLDDANLHNNMNIMLNIMFAWANHIMREIHPPIAYKMFLAHKVRSISTNSC